MGMSNIVLVTTRPRNSRVARDLEDYLMVKVGGIRVVKSRFSGLLVIETEAKPEDVARLIVKSPFMGNAVFRVVPIMEQVNTLDLMDVANRALPRLSNTCRGMKVLIRCRARGYGISDSQCELELARILRDRGVNVGVKSPDCIMLVECWDSGCGILIDRLDSIKEYAFVNVK